MMIVRENTEGLYIQRERSDGETAIADRVITRTASERIARLACELAAARRGHLTIVHKANVLPETCGLFRKTAQAVAEDYPGLQVDEVLVDTMALRLIRDPESFDVVVTTNMFGDILSDEAAGLVGGLGMAPSGNIGEKHAIFEPVHGTAPRLAGRGIANPIATILSARMMLEWLEEREAAAALEESVVEVLREGETLTPDLGGSAGTMEVAASVRRKLAEKEF